MDRLLLGRRVGRRVARRVRARRGSGGGDSDDIMSQLHLPRHSSLNLAGKKKKRPDTKIILVGNSCVGKSALIHRVLKDEYDDFPAPTAGVVGFPVSKVPGYSRPIQIMELGGALQYRNHHRYFLDSVAGIILCVGNSKDDVETVEYFVKVLRDRVQDQYGAKGVGVSVGPVIGVSAAGARVSPRASLSVGRVTSSSSGFAHASETKPMSLHPGRHDDSDSSGATSPGGPVSRYGVPWSTYGIPCVLCVTKSDDFPSGEEERDPSDSASASSHSENPPESSPEPYGMPFLVHWAKRHRLFGAMECVSAKTGLNCWGPFKRVLNMRKWDLVAGALRTKILSQNEAVAVVLGSRAAGRRSVLRRIMFYGRFDQQVTSKHTAARRRVSVAFPLVVPGHSASERRAATGSPATPGIGYAEKLIFGMITNGETPVESFLREETESKSIEAIVDLYETSDEFRLARFVTIATAVILVYDVTDPNSFDEALQWGRKIRSRNSRCRIYLVSSKCDLAEEQEGEQEEKEGEETPPPSASGGVAVSAEAAAKVALENGWRHYEVSSKTTKGLYELKCDLLRISRSLTGLYHPVDYLHCLYHKEAMGMLLEAISGVEKELHAMSNFRLIKAAWDEFNKVMETVKPYQFLPTSEARRRCGEYLDSYGRRYQDSVVKLEDCAWAQAERLLKTVRVEEEGRILGVPEDEVIADDEETYFHLEVKPARVVIVADDAQNGDDVKVYRANDARGLILTRHHMYRAYHGPFRGGAAHGENGQEFDKRGKRMVFQGNYRHGVRFGRGSEFQKSGELKFRGMYRNGLRHGRGEEYGRDGTTVSLKGMWRNGVLFRVDDEAVQLRTFDFKTIRKQFIPQNRLGDGASGEVFKVKYPPHAIKAHIYAAKVIRASGMDVEFAATRVLRLCASLTHPNLVRVHAYSKRPLCYLMTYCLCSVAEVIGGKFDHMFIVDLEFKIKLLYQTALGAKYLHSNSIMHRDMKWANVLLDEMHDVRLCDFDFAKVDEAAWRLSAQNMTFCGTPLYLCPEIVRGEAYTMACDVYSYGNLHPFALVNRCTCGSPFNSHNFTHHVGKCRLRPPERLPNEPDIEFPVWLVDLMKVCWADSPDRRPTFDDIVDIITQHHKTERECWSEDSHTGALTLHVREMRVSEVGSLSEHDVVVILSQPTLAELLKMLTARWTVTSLDEVLIVVPPADSTEVSLPPQPIRSESQLSGGCTIILPKTARDHTTVESSTNPDLLRQQNAALRWRLGFESGIKVQLKKTIDDLESQVAWLQKELVDARKKLEEQADEESEGIASDEDDEESDYTEEEEEEEEEGSYSSEEEDEEEEGEEEGEEEEGQGGEQIDDD